MNVFRALIVDPGVGIFCRVGFRVIFILEGTLASFSTFGS